MAVPKNVALSTVTSATSAPQCQSFSSSINTLHTVSGDHSVASCSDLKVKTHLTPAKVIQALPVASGRNSSPQVIRIIKQSEMPTIAVSSHMKATLASPIKGTIINLSSGPKVLTKPGTKLKVGDTITLQKHSATETASVQPMIPPTAAKFITVGSSQASVSAVASLPLPHASAIVSSGTNCDEHGSPSHLGPITQVWTQSPQCKRSAIYHDALPVSESKRRRTPTSSEKGSKGLRHFAMLVCEKVKQKVTTTYNEVADELVAEYTDSQKQNDQAYDQKNIRRRVYDALNVLMAMEIIYKDKKDIHWVGLPTNSVQEVQALQIEKKKREQRIQQKTLQLHELILQQIAFKNLVQRNKRIQQTQGPPPENSSIQLPFIIVNTSKKTVIDCSISNDKYEYMFNFDNTFEIHDDIEVLKRMGMAYGLEAGKCTPENLRTAQTLVPPVLKPYLQDMAGQGRISSGISSSTPSMQEAAQIVPRSELPHVAHILESTELPLGRAVKIEQSKDCSAAFLGIDSDDQEVAMVTDESQRIHQPSSVIASLTSSSASSSTLRSGPLSLTPASSCTDLESGGSRGSTPVGPPYDV